MPRPKQHALFGLAYEMAQVLLRLLACVGAIATVLASGRTKGRQQRAYRVYQLTAGTVVSGGKQDPANAELGTANTQRA